LKNTLQIILLKKSYYTSVRSKSQVKPTVRPLTDNGGSLVFTEKDMGNVLNEYFASVFIVENTEHLPVVKSVSGDMTVINCAVMISVQMC